MINEFIFGLGNKKKDKEKDLNDFSIQRLDFKLSLRKKKNNNIINQKRIFSSCSNNKENISINNNTNDNIINMNNCICTNKCNLDNNINNIKWNLELSINNIPIPKSYKKEFSTLDVMINASKDNILCVDVIPVRYGVCLLKDIFKKENIEQNKMIMGYIDLSFIEELIYALEEFCFKKEKDIVFNILYIINKYILINKEKNLIKLLLDPFAYKVWELCFILNDIEIICQLLLLLNIISSERKEFKIDILCSSYLRDTFIKLFQENQELKKFEENMNEIKLYNNELLKYKFLVERGVFLFCNLISISMKAINIKYKEKIYQINQIILAIIIDFTNINSKNIYSTCIESIYKATDNEPRLFEILEKSTIFEKILSQKYDFNEVVRINGNRILGNYIAMKDGLDHNFFVNVVKYNLDLLFSIQNINLIIKEIVWVLSNIIHDDIKIATELFDNHHFMGAIIHYFKGIKDCKEINDISLFIQILIFNINKERFDILINNGFIEIIVEQGKKMADEGKNIFRIFELFDEMLTLGENYKSYYNDINLVLEKFEILGLKEVFEKNIGSKYEIINEISENICEKYFDIKTYIE